MPAVQTIGICTASGQPIVFLDPSQTAVLSSDLYIALSRVCRYGGHVPFSVLQHLALCVKLAERWCADNAALDEALPYIAAHDLHEAYVGDLVNGLKQVLPEFRARIEEPWKGHVHLQLGLLWPPPDSVRALVRWVDLRALAVEMTEFRHPYAERVVDAAYPVGEDERQMLRWCLERPTPALWGVVAKAIG